MAVTCLSGYVGDRVSHFVVVGILAVGIEFGAVLPGVVAVAIRRVGTVVGLRG